MKMKNILSAWLLILFLVSGKMHAQESGSESLLMIAPSVAFQVPAGDLADRFGSNSTIGSGFHYKTKSNWLFMADFNYIFGNRIREDSLIQNLLNEDGFVISDEGRIADVSFFERGFYSTIRVGKIIPVFGSNPNSGLMITAGAGYLQHKIHIKVEDNIAAALRGDYKKGYDRLSDGFSTVQFIGYQHIGKSRLANFFAGFEFVQAWTKNRRSMNFDTMRRDDKDRFDVLYGLKAGWVIPIRKRDAKDFYYY
jgi:hypothetical protein